MSRASLSLRLACGVLVIASPMALTGCGKAESAQTDGPPRDASLRTAAPAETVDSVLHFVRAYLDGVAKRDTKRATDARDQLAWHLAARDEIVRRSGGGATLPPTKVNELVENAVKNWAAVLAFFDDAINLAAAQDVPGSTATRRKLIAPARVGNQNYELIFSLETSPDGWRLRSIDVEPPSPAGAAATQPTPATGPSTRPG